MHRGVLVLCVAACGPSPSTGDAGATDAATTDVHTSDAAGDAASYPLDVSTNGIVRSIAFDRNGNLAIVGTAHGANDDAWLARLSIADGTPLWSKELNGAGNFDDSAFDLRVTASNDMIAIGSNAATNGDCAGEMWSYDEAGTQKWSQCKSQAGDALRFDAIELAADGNVVATGQLTTSSTSTLFAGKFDASSGAQMSLWTSTGQPALAEGAGIGVLSTGHLVIVTTLPTNHAYAFELDLAGQATGWTWTDATSGSTQGLGVVVGAGDAVYVLGKDGLGALWVKKLAAGVEAATFSPAPSENASAPGAIALADTGNVLLGAHPFPKQRLWIQPLSSDLAPSTLFTETTVDLVGQVGVRPIATSATLTCVSVELLAGTSVYPRLRCYPAIH